MIRDRMFQVMRVSAALSVALLLVPLSTGAAAAGGLDLQAEQALIEQWRAQRVEALTSDSGWLTLAGLFWLQEGDNSFGRGAGNALVLDNAALADHCGTFIVSAHSVRFVAAPGSGVTHAGQPVSSLAAAATRRCSRAGRCAFS